MDSLQQYSELLLFSLRRHSGILTHTWLNRHLARSFRVASRLKGRSNSEPSSEQRKANDGTGQLALKQKCTINHHFTHVLLKYTLFQLLATVLVDPEITASAEPGWWALSHKPFSTHPTAQTEEKSTPLLCLSYDEVLLPWQQPPYTPWRGSHGCLSHSNHNKRHIFVQSNFSLMTTRLIPVSHQAQTLDILGKAARVMFQAFRDGCFKPLSLCKHYINLSQACRAIL